MNNEILVRDEGGKALERAGVTVDEWRVLCDVVWPNTSKEMRFLALSYCRARRLDPFKRPVHIVQVWDSESRKMKEQVWEGLNSLLTTASRTGGYAGIDAPVFGQTIEYRGIAAPEWCSITVYRMVSGVRCPFTSHPVYFDEAVALKKGGEPNRMWSKRPFGQLAKCATAAALRLAFPEELGGAPTAEEMEGQDVARVDAVTIPPASETVTNLLAEAKSIVSGETPAEVIDVRPESETKGPEATCGQTHYDPEGEPVFGGEEHDAASEAVSLPDLHRLVMSASQGITNDGKKKAAADAFCPEIPKGVRWGEYVKSLGAGDAGRLLEELRKIGGAS